MKSSHRTVYLSTLVAALGGFLFGFDTAVISGAERAIESFFVLEDFWLGFTVAAALIGTIIGALTAGQPADKFGRRNVLIGLAVCFFISALGSALTSSWVAFILYRLLGGIAVGGVSVVAPMYIAEISPADVRGRLVAAHQLNIVVGILMAYISNYIVAQYVPAAVSWRWMLGVEAAPAALFFGLLFLVPNSPRWLVKNERPDDARDVLAWLGISSIDESLKQIQASLIKERHRPSEPLFQADYMFVIFLAWAVAMFNQLSGINALMYYAPRIFEMAGAATDAALLQSVAIGGTNLVFTLVGMSIIDKFGRRPLILVGSLGTAACLGIVAYEFYAVTPGVLVLIGLLGFIAFFALSQGAVIWVFISEIFPNRVRSKGQSLGSATHWVMAALVTWVFPIIADASGGHAFAFFSAMMLLQFFFAWFIMPETKGLTLEEMEHKLGISPEELEEEFQAELEGEDLASEA